MLGKLLKYEIKSVSRIFLPLYASLIIFAILNNVFIRINSNSTNKLFISIVSGISIFAYVFLIIAIFVFTLFVMIQRFYKNLLGDEGYLMFTLPASTDEHITVKLLTSMMWVISSIITTIFSVMIISYNEKFFVSFKHGINQMILELNRVFDINGYILLIELIVLFLVVLATQILMIYASIAIGQMVSKHKLLGSFGAYLGFYVISQIVVSIIAVSCYYANPEYWASITYNNTMPHIAFIGIIILNVVFAAIYYITTKLILFKHLNLE